MGWVRSVAFEPGNEWFCTGSADRTIKVRGGGDALRRKGHLNWCHLDSYQSVRRFASCRCGRTIKVTGEAIHRKGLQTDRDMGE